MKNKSGPKPLSPQRKRVTLSVALRPDVIQALRDHAGSSGQSVSREAEDILASFLGIKVTSRGPAPRHS
jgi:hypothetical protein